LDGTVAGLLPRVEELVRLPEQLTPDLDPAIAAIDHRL
jgi:hypothetical protein